MQHYRALKRSGYAAAFVGAWIAYIAIVQAMAG